MHPPREKGVIIISFYVSSFIGFHYITFMKVFFPSSATIKLLLLFPVVWARFVVCKLYFGIAQIYQLYNSHKSHTKSYLSLICGSSLISHLQNSVCELCWHFFFVFPENCLALLVHRLLVQIPSDQKGSFISPFSVLAVLDCGFLCIDPIDTVLHDHLDL